MRSTLPALPRGQRLWHKQWRPGVGAHGERDQACPTLDIYMNVCKNLDKRALKAYNGGAVKRRIP